MVSLSLMARLVEAVRPDARLVLVGDPGPADLDRGRRGARRHRRRGRRARRDRRARAGVPLRRRDRHAWRRRSAAATPTAPCTRCARRRTSPGSRPTSTDGDADALAPVRDGAVDAARAVIEAARAGDARCPIDALGAFRLLCAHRLGAHGVATWTDRIEGWLAAEVGGFGTEGRWYAGPPAARDRERLRAAASTTATPASSWRPARDRVTAAFERRGEVVEYSPARLGAVDTVYAMTVHKSQGSQFGTAAVLLPEPTSQILTRELLYTAVTRAQRPPHRRRRRGRRACGGRAAGGARVRARLAPVG